MMSDAMDDHLKSVLKIVYDPDKLQQRPDTAEQRKFFYVESPIVDIFHHNNPSFKKRRQDMQENYHLATDSLNLLAPHETL